MQDLYAQLIDVANAVWKRRWSVLLVAWAVCLLGWGFVISKPGVYTASTRIFVDTASVLKPLLEGLAIERDVNTELEVMKQTLTTRSNLERVARMTDLDITAATPAEMERLLDGLRNRTEVETDGRFLLSISYSDTDPVRARDVVQAISRIFIDTNLGQSREEIEDAELFLDRQIEQYERALDEAEQRLAEFKEQRLSGLPTQASSEFRVDELRNELEEAEAKLKHARTRQARLRVQLSQMGTTVGGAEQIAKAEQELQILLATYTEKHPEVIAQRRKIAGMKADLAPVSNGAPGTGEPSGFAGDAQRTSLQIELSLADADAAAESDRVRRLQARIERLQSLAAEVPGAEADLARLNRDYDVIKIQHAELLARRQQARLSRDREAGAERIHYEVVDPPRVPAIPDGPPRNVLLSAVLVVGLVSGVGVAILLSYASNSFSDPVQIRQAFGVAVLGTVSLVQSAGRQTWQAAKLTTFASCAALLIAAYAVVMVAGVQDAWASLIPQQTVHDIFSRLSELAPFFEVR